MNSVTAMDRQDIDAIKASEVRVSGTVQGVGFRPFVWRLANACGLSGDVRNSAAGVLIRVSGKTKAIEQFLVRLRSEAPPLSHIDQLETEPSQFCLQKSGFHILDSVAGETRTQVTPDAAACPKCVEEVLMPSERRFRYPFANCTHCGPRFSIIKQVPYDRAATTMSSFAMCEDCASEYNHPSDRRFHAQPIACHECGPKAWIERLDDAAASVDSQSTLDSVDTAIRLIQSGEIVAIRGLGGFHLACDAVNAQAVSRLRERKKRYGKPFALMARDLDVIRRYAKVSDQEAELLSSPEAPIVLLDAVQHDPAEQLPIAIAPGMNTLGFMLAYMPLHHLLLRKMNHPIVMTSGNLMDEPQITIMKDAKSKLCSVADYALFHDRDIANRIDDSVVRVMGNQPRVLRRARGYAPGAMALPDGFERAPDLIAFGGELKAAFCIVKDGAAILSQHQGDLENADTFDDYQKNLLLYQKLYDHEPKLLVADKHPEYLSTKLAKVRAQKESLPLIEVQHHHAHIASCMAENSVALDAGPVLGIALDGLGLGDDGTIWGGEFLLADYRNYERLGTFKPVAMLGGAQAIREPWRNAYAHIISAMSWSQFDKSYNELDLHKYLEAKPRETLDQMLAKDINAPLASSCGRLFDAVAAAMGLVRDTALFEGQGAMLLESAVDKHELYNEDEDLAYAFEIADLEGTAIPVIEPTAMWKALLGDLMQETPVPVMAARFHKSLAKIICAMVDTLSNAGACNGTRYTAVALSGGCFQNKVLLEEVETRLSADGFEVLTQSQVPANDGGLALGQAVIAAARNINKPGASRGL
ncbi:MAG: carbamoyltransferase HypF [Alphaproteobacteria bacterium]|nr:carbamoyltransferase HypF [Alphaproteobacteria bacterium]